MIKSLVLKLVKKYAISAIKDAVAAKKDDVATWAKKVNGWAAKVQSVLLFLRSLADKLSDGELTDAEADDTICEAKDLAESITK